MPDGFGAAAAATFKFLKGRVEKREAIWNTLLWLVHQAPGFCVQGTFPAEDPWTNPADDQKYAFWFWTVNGQPVHPDPTDPNPLLPPEGYDCVSRAVQWYSKGGGSGPPTMFLWAFNMASGTFSSESPVQAPPEAVGQNHVETAGQGWTIIAKDSIGSGNLIQPFHHWWKTGSAPQAPYNKQLVVAQGSGGSAVAFYGTYPGDGVFTPGGGGGVAVKPTKDALAEVKGAGLEFENLHDLSIYVRRLSDRLDRLEEGVARGRAFISGAERPKVGGRDPRGGG